MYHHNRTYNRYRASTIAALTVSFCSCFFNTELPLENDIPTCNNMHAINTSLLFPDSSICTLRINDRNDYSLFINESEFPTNSPNSLPGDTCNVVSWPGTYRFLSSGYGPKLLHLILDTNRMGIYCGMLQIYDHQDASIEIPYTITKQFIDPFDTYPLSPLYWQLYHENDSTTLSYSYTDHKLIFTFDPDSDTPSTNFSTGIHSKFTVSSSFTTSVRVKLRDDMDDAFETSFFISSNADTGRWTGEKAGIYLSGINNRIRFDCRSTQLQHVSFETTITSGEIGITRTDSTVRFFFHNGNPSVAPIVHAALVYPPETPVYIHLKMTVRDLSKVRNCYWSDFKISNGIITLPSQSARSSQAGTTIHSDSDVSAVEHEQEPHGILQW